MMRCFWVYLLAYFVVQTVYWLAWLFSVSIYSLFFQRATISMILKHFPDFKYTCDTVQFGYDTDYCTRVGTLSGRTLAWIQACPCNGLMLCFFCSLRECSISLFVRQVFCLWKEKETNQHIEFQPGASDSDCNISSFLSYSRKISWRSKQPWYWFSLLLKSFDWGCRAWRSIREGRQQCRMLRNVLSLIFKLTYFILES